MISETTSQPRTVLLLGGSGFIGQALQKSLARAGMRVVAPDRKQLDLGDPESCRQLPDLLQRADHLINLAALTPDRGRDLDTFRMNLNHIENLCHALREQPVAHVLYFSSDAVYGSSAGALAPISEVTPAAADDLYGLMHRTREILLSEVVQERLCILRPTLIFGPGDTHNSYGPNRFRRQAAEKGEIVLGGAGEDCRDHLYVEDLAQLVVQIIQGHRTGLFNAASGVSREFMEVAYQVAACFDEPIQIRPTPRRQSPSRREFDISLLQTAFPKWRITPFSDALARSQQDLPEAENA